MIEDSGDLIGAVVGGAIGLVGGPAGAMGGAAAGVVIGKTVRRVGIEVWDRLLVARQQKRVGTVLWVAINEAHARADAGEEIRADGFFESTVGGRSDADELLEGILLQAANAYQERKLRYLGAILPSLAVRSDVSPADGHWLARLADRLSWRQLVVLAIFADPPEQMLAEREYDWDQRQSAGPTGGMSEEATELANLGLLGYADSDGDLARIGVTFEGASGIWTVPRNRWRLTDQGRLLVEVARLDEVPSAERDPVLQDLVA